MLSTDSTKILIGLEDITVKKVTQSEEVTEIEIEMERKIMNCPCCGAATRTVHDYRTQRIKDIPAFGKNVIIILTKRRYRCKCGKRFAEEVKFLPKYYRMTNRLVAYVIAKLCDVCSFTSVAKFVNLSVTTVIRLFDSVNYSAPKLPKVLSIDEFKGNTNGEKYQCILTDPENGIVLDILPKRYSYYLSEYLKDKNKEDVSFFISDMWKQYFEIAETYLKKAVPIVDKYHWIRQIIWAFEAVRKQEQKKFMSSHRRYFKRSKALLIKRFDFLSDDEKSQVNVMLYSSAALSRSHFLKESFLKILDCNDSTSAKIDLSAWILDAQDSNIHSFVNCAKTMITWSKGILNSFDYPFTNGFTEGCNNKIKVLKRNAYGFRNFSRFRNRILHMFNYQKAKSEVAA